jgi:moderate conductance mechanosensitive channel
MPRLAVLLITRLLPEPELLADMGIRVVIIFLLAFLGQRLLYLAIGRAEKFMISAGHGEVPAAARARTLGETLRRLTTVLVYAVAALQSLAVLGWDVRPLLAGAGVVGVALGFGAQTLVRDLIAGIFILSENQYSVGDVIEIDGKPAAVEALSLRSTTLRDFNGYVHFVPNGELKTVTNRSRGWTRLAVDAPVGADQSLERALEACRRVVEAMNLDPEWKSRLLDPIELWGVESLTGAEAQIRMVVRARPGADAPEAARELRLRVHRSLSETGIRTTHSREIAITPLAAALAAGAPRAGDAAPRSGGKAGRTAAVGS